MTDVQLSLTVSLATCASVLKALDGTDDWECEYAIFKDDVKQAAYLAGYRLNPKTYEFEPVTES